MRWDPTRGSGRAATVRIINLTQDIPGDLISSADVEVEYKVYSWDAVADTRGEDILEEIITMAVRSMRVETIMTEEKGMIVETVGVGVRAGSRVPTQPFPTPRRSAAAIKPQVPPRRM